MKYRPLAALASLIVLTASASAAAAESTDTTLSGPFSHENLDIYLIHGADTLKRVGAFPDRAFKQG